MFPRIASDTKKPKSLSFLDQQAAASLVLVLVLDALDSSDIEICSWTQTSITYLMLSPILSQKSLFLDSKQPFEEHRRKDDLLYTK